MDGMPSIGISDPVYNTLFSQLSSRQKWIYTLCALISSALIGVVVGGIFAAGLSLFQPTLTREFQTVCIGLSVIYSIFFLGQVWVLSGLIYPIYFLQSAILHIIIISVLGPAVGTRDMTLSTIFLVFFYCLGFIMPIVLTFIAQHPPFVQLQIFILRLILGAHFKQGD
jgi:hypothetical protein